LNRNLVWITAWLLLMPATAARSQGVDPVGRPIRAVRVAGTQQIDPQLVLNQIRVSAGDAYDPDAVARDIRNITRLGHFQSVRAEVRQHPDGGLILTYMVDERPLLEEVRVAGNKALGDEKLLGELRLRAGDPRDEFLIQQGAERIKQAYEEAGYYLAEVAVDEEALAESDVLIYRVREGPRVRIRDIQFEGNRVFTARQLKNEIGSREYVFILEAGELSEEQLDQDVASLREFYEARGYLNVRVSRQIQLSPDQKEAIVTFLIDEGAQYTVADIRFNLTAGGRFGEAQLREAMPLKRGDVYSAQKRQNAVEAVRDLYGKVGYLPAEDGGQTRVAIERVFREDEPTVDLIVTVEEGRKYTVGAVDIRGNQVTQERVIRREVRGLEPGRVFDRTGLAQSERKIRQTGLFRDTKITVQGEPEDEVRDVLVEVKEGRTGSISLGAAISSDAGLLGAFDLTQRNFDIMDWPQSFGELVSGEAFRGAGQQFSISLQPGDELQRYSVAWSDPYVFDTNYFLSLRGQFFTRQRDDYDEERLGGFVSVGKRFGDVWSASVSTRYEQVSVQDIDSDAPVDVFAVEDDAVLDGLEFSVTRSTVDDRIFPTRGTRLVAGLEHVGLLTDDFSFTRFSAEANAFFTVDEDFFGRKTVLSLRSEIGLILDEGERTVTVGGTDFRVPEVPIYERFFAGGHNSFRGFDFRGVGPRGVVPSGAVGDDAVGGRWLWLLGVQYNYPIYQEIVRGVFFVDSGTVDEDVAVDKWRLSVGAGVRLKLPILGQAPFAFDLAYPVLEEEGDETRVFSFSIALPF